MVNQTKAREDEPAKDEQRTQQRWKKKNTTGHKQLKTPPLWWEKAQQNTNALFSPERVTPPPSNCLHITEFPVFPSLSVLLSPPTI